MSPAGQLLIGLAILAWLLFAAACGALRRTPRRDVPGQLVWAALFLYVRLVHRVRYTGLGLAPRGRATDQNTHVWTHEGGPLIIVANHTAGVDPLLIHLACPYEIRWMMMRTMMPPAFDGFWEWMGVIAVGPSGQDAQAARVAIRHLKEGGVIGVFPEGGIERPARHVLPFEPGVGLLVTRTKARVLLAVIEGTPDAPNAYLSLFMPSRSRVRFVTLADYSETKLGAAEIAADLQARAAAALGWPTAAKSSTGDPHTHRTTDSGGK